MASVTEVWLPIDFGYELSSEGKVRNKNGKIIKPDTTGNHGGYLRIQLRRYPRIRLNLSRLILETFVGSAPTKASQARHKNGNHFDNRLDNLEWGTVQENSDDKHRHGTHPSQLKGKKKS